MAIWQALNYNSPALPRLSRSLFIFTPPKTILEFYYSNNCLGVCKRVILDLDDEAERMVA